MNLLHDAGLAEVVAVVEGKHDVSHPASPDAQY
jgi:hypothetical protein